MGEQKTTATAILPGTDTQNSSTHMKPLDPTRPGPADETDATSASATISAIVVSYFTGPLLARSIDALAAQKGVSEIIIVDNGNWAHAVENVIKEMPSNGPAIEVIAGQGNVGFARACNLGARAARGDILLFVNPDAIMPPGGARLLATAGSAKQGPWMMGAKLVNPDGTEQQGSRRETLTPWRAFVEATKIYRLAPKHPYFRRFNLHAEPCPENIIPVPTVSGACFCLPRQDYFDIGGMDEKYFLHVEDIDFCLRFSAAGGGVYFNPNVEILHFKSSSRVNPLFVEARKTRSMIRYFKTHFSEPYPVGFVSFVGCCLWGVFGAKTALHSSRRVLGLVGLRRRSSAVYRRAVEYAAARKNSR